MHREHILRTYTSDTAKYYSVSYCAFAKNASALCPGIVFVNEAPNKIYIEFMAFRRVLVFPAAEEWHFFVFSFHRFFCETCSEMNNTCRQNRDLLFLFFKSAVPIHSRSGSNNQYENETNFVTILQY